MVLVDLALATICFAGQCYPALVGQNTVRGEFVLQQRLTESPGYGGDVLQFRETEDTVMAIHRVWLLKPSERRAERLKSSNAKDRRFITNGCVNVAPDVYQKLLECCSAAPLVVR